MKQYDVVIIGGGPAGFTAAISARNTYLKKRIAVIRKEAEPMIPCGIPYIFHSLDNIEDNILPDSPLEKMGVDVIVDEVVRRTSYMLYLASGESVHFEKLVVATGSTVTVPPIKGVDKEQVYYVKKDKNYLETLKKEISKKEKIVIIGGGFVGLEVADELVKEKKKITLVERLGHLLPLAMDKEFGDIIEKELVAAGTDVLTNTSVEEIIGDKAVSGVLLDNGEKIDCEMVIVSAGYRPNIELAKKMGLKCEDRYGILVDEYLRTSEKDIFAVGDCAAKRNCYTGEYSNIMLASTAMAEGRLVGSNLYDIKVVRKFMGVLGSFSTKIAGVAV